MRHFILFIFLVLTGSAIAQSTEQAHVYMQTIGNQFYQISNDRMSYTSAASHGKSARKVEKKRTELINTIKTAEASIRKMKAFNGSVAYRDSVVSYLKLNRIVLTEDYGKILDMEEIAEQSYDAMEAYMLAKEKAEEKLDVAFEKSVSSKNYLHQRITLSLLKVIASLARSWRHLARCSPTTIRFTSYSLKATRMRCIYWMQLGETM